MTQSSDKHANLILSFNFRDCRTRLATALETRYDVQEQLDVVMKTIFEAGAQVKKLQVENYLHIAELMSAMKMNSPPATATVTPTVRPTYIFPSPTPTANNKFVLGESIFILRLFQSGTLKGEIRIRPAPTFHPEFLQHLGKFCYKSPKDFVTTVNKVSPTQQLEFEIHFKNGHF